MTAIDITNIIGLTFPYNIYACDVYGNQCILIATINTGVPPPNIIVLPIQFNTAPAVGIKVVTSDGCERFEIVYCSIAVEQKQFQNDDNFDFMDGSPYQFMFQ